MWYGINGGYKLVFIRALVAKNNSHECSDVIEFVL